MSAPEMSQFGNSVTFKQLCGGPTGPSRVKNAHKGRAQGAVSAHELTSLPIA